MVKVGTTFVVLSRQLGGNKITGTFLGESGNLHHVWDYSIVNTRITRDFNGNQNDFTTYLIDKINGEWKADAKGAWLASHE